MNVGDNLAGYLSQRIDAAYVPTWSEDGSWGVLERRHALVNGIDVDPCSIVATQPEAGV